MFLLRSHSNAMISTLVVGSALAVYLVLAQTEPAPPTPPARPPASVRATPPERLGPLSGLEPEARQAVTEVLRRTQQETREPMGRLRQLRRELQAAGWAEKLDDALITSHARQIGELEGQIARIRARAAAELRPQLKPEQIERLRSAGPEFWEQAWGVRPASAPGRPGAVERPRAGAANRPPVAPPPSTPLPPKE